MGENKKSASFGMIGSLCHRRWPSVFECLNHFLQKVGCNFLACINLWPFPLSANCLVSQSSVSHGNESALIETECSRKEKDSKWSMEELLGDK